MPVKVLKRGDKFRIIESATGRIAMSDGGKAVDGGGHKTKSKAKRQARAINSGKGEGQS